MHHHGHTSPHILGGFVHTAKCICGDIAVLSAEVIAVSWAKGRCLQPAGTAAKRGETEARSQAATYSEDADGMGFGIAVGVGMRMEMGWGWRALECRKLVGRDRGRRG